MRDKEKSKKYFADWYSKPENKLRTNLRSRLWALANPDKVRISQERWALANPRVRMTDKTRFNKFADIKGDNECWNWLGSKLPSGYGKTSYKGKHIYAHRFSFLIHHGEIPDDKQVLHVCDNPSCVNFKHLWLGTIKQNMRDRDEKKRDRWSKQSVVLQSLAGSMV